MSHANKQRISVFRGILTLRREKRKKPGIRKILICARVMVPIAWLLQQTHSLIGQLEVGGIREFHRENK